MPDTGSSDRYGTASVWRVAGLQEVFGLVLRSFMSPLPPRSFTAFALLFLRIVRRSCIRDSR
jgi:hypothetical protein